MRLLFEINHPAHVHLFRHLIQQMRNSGHECRILAKSEPLICSLLDYYGLAYIKTGAKGRSLWGKAWRQIGFTLRAISHAWRFKADIGIGVSVTLPWAGMFCRMKTLVLDDDDKKATPLFALLAHGPANRVLRPDCLRFEKGGKKVHYYPGLHELAYLHPDLFRPDKKVIMAAGLQPGTYIVVRFSGLSAHHDRHIRGIEDKAAFIRRLATLGRVVITGEVDLPAGLESYQLPVPPADIHHLLGCAKLLVSDSQSMSSEAACLGVPSVRITDFNGRITYLKMLEERYGLTFGFSPDDMEGAWKKIDAICSSSTIQQAMQKGRAQLLQEKVNTTHWLVDFIKEFNV